MTTVAEVDRAICLCGKPLEERRGYGGQARFVHTRNGRVECYPESQNVEDASYYRATPANVLVAAS